MGLKMSEEQPRLGDFEATQDRSKRSTAATPKGKRQNKKTCNILSAIT